MTLQQLQYVIALDTHRHFVRAAEHCHVSQPTLTLQVKKLEEEIGLLIFDRSTQPLSPTVMGRKFILKARQILREVDELKAMVNEDRMELAGTFQVGIIPTLAPSLLPLFVKAFSDAHPDVKLAIREMQSEQIVLGLLKGTLDIAIMATPLKESHLRELPMFYEPFWIYAHPEHAILEVEPLHPDKIDHNGLWLLDEGHCFRNQVLNICGKVHLQPLKGISFQGGSIETLKQLVQSDVGYTLIPELAVDLRVDESYIKSFVSPQPAREISLVVHTSFTKELLLTRLRQVILTKIPDHFQKNEYVIRVNWR